MPNHPTESSPSGTNETNSKWPAEWLSGESTAKSQELKTALFLAKDEVQRLYNQIHYDRSLTPEQLDRKRLLLSEAEKDLFVLQNPSTNG